jgi:ribosome-associated protein
MRKSLRINENLSIPISELRFRTSRSGGAGGQNVNRVETKVELLFDVEKSPSLSAEHKQRVFQVLRSHMDREGVLHLESQETRSQLQNRELVIERFIRLLHQALKPIKKRRPTKPPSASKEERLEEKKRRKHAKKSRQKVTSDW